MRTKRNKLDRYIGELSYPVYISHFLVVSCLTGLGWREGYVAVPVTIVVSTLYHLIDRPVDSFRHKWATGPRRVRRRPPRRAGSEQLPPEETIRLQAGKNTMLV